MHIHRNCIFLIDREPDKPDGKLRYRIKWEGQTVAFNVGFRVEFDKWSRETQRCKNNTTHGKKKVSAATINCEIDRFERVADEVFQAFETAGSIPTADEFRIPFNRRNGKGTTPDKTLFDVFDEFTAEMGSANQWTGRLTRSSQHSKIILLLLPPNFHSTSSTKRDCMTSSVTCAIR